MEVFLSSFLRDHGHQNRVDFRLKPARIVLENFQNTQPVICIHDGHIYLEEFTGTGRINPIDLADPRSLELLLRVVEEHKQRDLLGQGPDHQSNTTDASRSGA